MLQFRVGDPGKIPRMESQSDEEYEGCAVQGAVGQRLLASFHQGRPRANMPEFRAQYPKITNEISVRHGVIM